MPYRVNGIGTGYYGKKNVSARNGVCRSCGKGAMLTSYDTREWFSVVFVPVVPLVRFRILDECSVCRKHFRVKLVDFQRDLDAKVRPLREAVAKRPQEAEGHRSLVEALCGFQLWGEAETAVRSGIALHPADAGLRRLAAGLASLRGDPDEALVHFEKLVALAPSDAEARLDLGRTLHVLERHADAVRVLDEARKLDPNLVDASLLRAESQYALGNHAEAVSDWQRAFDRAPELAKDRALLRRVAECKEKLGWPLSDEERRARRRWWPFGGKSKTKAPVRPAEFAAERRRTSLRALAVFAGLVVLAAFGALGYGWWKMTHVDVYLVNSTGKAVRVSLDGREFPLPGGPPEKQTLAPGAHRIAVTGSDGKKIEERDFRVTDATILEALTEGRFGVFNVAQAAILERREVVYYPTDSPSNEEPPEPQLIPFASYVEQTNVDYVFRAAPEHIELSNHERRAVKIAFDVAPRELGYNALAVRLFGEGKKKEAEQALAKAIELEPCNAFARGNVIDIYEQTDRADEALAQAKAWILCPDAGIEAHRTFQNLRLARGEREALQAEYKARLDAKPDSGLNHYLYGRLLEDAEAEIAEMRLATARDPKLTRPWLALGDRLLVLDRPAEAMEAFRPALDLPPVDGDEAPSLFAQAAIGAGKSDEAAKILAEHGAKPGKRGEAEGRGFERARWSCALAAEHWDEAEKIEKTLPDDPKSVEAWHRRTLRLRLSGRDSDLDAALALAEKKPELAESLPFVRFERNLDRGEWKEAAAGAVAVAAKLPAEPAALYRCYGVAALLLAGDRPGATGRLAEVTAALGAEKSAQSPWKEILAALAIDPKGKPVVDPPGAKPLSSEMRKHLDFFRGARAAALGRRDEATRDFELCRSHALDLEMPYLAAKRLLVRKG